MGERAGGLRRCLGPAGRRHRCRRRRRGRRAARRCGGGGESLAGPGGQGGEEPCAPQERRARSRLLRPATEAHRPRRPLGGLGRLASRSRPVGKAPAIGFIGFGEAGYTIANGLCDAGVGRISAYDIAADDADRGPLIRERAGLSHTTLVTSSSALAAASDVLFSTVTSSSSLEAARQTTPFLQSRHIYADLNSVSPARKREIADVVRASGAGFVEAAVMAPVQPYGHRVPMLLGGDASERFIETMASFGMRLTDLHAEVGTAAAVKMCRS